MCGIAGVMRLGGGTLDLPAGLSAMARSIEHRGPDGRGYALLAPERDRCRFVASGDHLTGPGAVGFRCGFAHRRLAVIDLSNAGLQPMAGADGSLWITYNGEVFNYLELRVELEACGRAFRTETDTEVLLQAYDQWGEECLHRLNGMWAFAVWDTRRGSLFLARDRFGIKPLYYAARDGRLAFASEPKALLELPWVRRDPDERAVADYLVHSRADCFEWTFFAGIKRLEPGHCLRIPFAATSAPTPRRWWSLAETLSGTPPSDEDARERFRELLESSVRLRLRSDVPVGTCLSGGLDSTAVVCAARPWLSEDNQKVYSAVYDSSPEVDETRYIDEVVGAARVVSHKTHPTGESLLGDLDRLIYQQDEPFGSTSQYAQLRVFELVRRCGTTVTLDGQGADEELAGYHYFFPVHLAGLLTRSPVAAAREFAAYRAKTGAGLIPSVLATGAGFLSHRGMIRWANRYSPSRCVDWVSPRVAALARRIHEPPCTKLADRLNRRLYEVFTVSSLPALLRYEDRNSMAFSVEARLPFMDHRLVSYLFSLPADQKIRHGWTKFVMREALKGIIPDLVRLRTDKIGFATPEAQWYRTSVFEYMRRVLSDETTARRGYYRVDRLLALLERNAAGTVQAGRALWRALNLELWLRRFVD